MPVVSARPSSAPVGEFLLQTSHRAAVLGLLSLLGVLTSIYFGRDQSAALAATSGASILGICAAVLALSRAPRVALAAVIAMVGIAAAAVLLALSHPKLMTVGVVADALVCTAIVRGARGADGPAHGRETVGVLIFNLVLLTLALPLMLVDRIDVIRSAVQSVSQPIPTVPAQ